MPDIRWARFLGASVVMVSLLFLGSIGAAVLTVSEYWSIAFGVAHMALSSVAGYVIASLWPQRPWIRHVVFWGVLLIWISMLVPIAFFSPPGGTADGGDQLARMMLPIIIAGALLPYLADQCLGICDPQRMTRKPNNACPLCGYPIGVSAVCTECGTVLPKSNHASPASPENAR